MFGDDESLWEGKALIEDANSDGSEEVWYCSDRDKIAKNRSKSKQPHYWQQKLKDIFQPHEEEGSSRIVGRSSGIWWFCCIFSSWVFFLAGLGYSPLMAAVNASPLVSRNFLHALVPMLLTCLPNDNRTLDARHIHALPCHVASSDVFTFWWNSRRPSTTMNKTSIIHRVDADLLSALQGNVLSAVQFCQAEVLKMIMIWWTVFCTLS